MVLHLGTARILGTNRDDHRCCVLSFARGRILEVTSLD